MSQSGDITHSFYSGFDFNKKPAFSWINKLSAKDERTIKHSEVFFINGFVFNEFSHGLIVSTLECARDAQIAIFFLIEGHITNPFFMGLLRNKKHLEGL
jgi:hypothetical protein